MKELTSRTGYGTCKVCDQRKPKAIKTMYLDGSCHYVDDKGKSWNASTCPECYSARRKIKRKVHKPHITSCKECGAEFETKSKVQRFCSKSCQKKHNNDKRSLVKPSDQQKNLDPQ